MVQSLREAARLRGDGALPSETPDRIKELLGLLGGAAAGGQGSADQSPADKIREALKSGAAPRPQES